MKLEIIILNKVIQTQEGKCHMFSLILDVDFEFSNMFASLEMPVEFRKLIKDHGEGLPKKREIEYTGTKG